MKIKGETLSQCIRHEIRNQCRRLDKPLERKLDQIDDLMWKSIAKFRVMSAVMLAWTTHRCLDCGIQTAATREYPYMVHNHIWEQATGDPAPADSQNAADNGMLCISCLERRLGFQLCPEDFKMINPELAVYLFGQKEEGVLLVN